MYHVPMYHVSEAERRQTMNDKKVYIPDDVIEMAQSVNDLLIELARFQEKGGEV